MTGSADRRPAGNTDASSDGSRPSFVAATARGLPAAAIGALAQLDPPLAALMGGRGVLGVIAPLALALAVLASGLRTSVPRAPLKSEA